MSDPKTPRAEPVTVGSDTTSSSRQEPVPRQVEVASELARLLHESETARASAQAAQMLAEAARREADEANQAKSGFLATMSHELRTPLNAMIGYTQLLELGLAGPLTEQQRIYLERLASSSHHLLGLVNDVLDLSKIEAGEARVAHEDTMTGFAVRAAIDLVRPQADAKGVRLIDERSDVIGVPYVGDEDRVRQILVNLLSNAAKFTPSGGTIRIGCDMVDATPREAYYLQGDGPWTYIRVQDTGAGIPTDEQGRIFEPFHQVESGHTRRAGGTGLGLAISRQLARLMGGDLTVESEAGVGSTFTLWLPAARRVPGMPLESATERSARAERAAAALRTPGLGDVGELLRDAIDPVLTAYVARLRTDPVIPQGGAMRRVELEDHAVSLLADLAQSLTIVEDVQQNAADMVQDGSAIQRTIAESHGARRFAQGWDEAAVRRDLTVFREEVERAVRGRLPTTRRDTGRRVDSREAEAAVHVLLGFIDRAAVISRRAWRRAAGEADDRS